MNAAHQPPTERRWRFTLAQLFAVTVVAAVAMAFIASSHPRATAAYVAGAFCVGLATAALSRRVYGPLIGSFIGATLVCVAHSFVFWRPISLLLGAAVGSVIGLLVGRREAEVKGGVRVVMAALCVPFLNVFDATAGQDCSTKTYFCPYCRSETVEERFFGLERRRSSSSSLAEWYSTVAPDHRCVWRSTTLERLQADGGPASRWGESERLLSLSIDDQLEFMQHAPPEMQRRFFNLMDAVNAPLQDAGLKIARDFLAERRRADPPVATPRAGLQFRRAVDFPPLFSMMDGGL